MSSSAEWWSGSTILVYLCFDYLVLLAPWPARTGTEVTVSSLRWVYSKLLYLGSNVQLHHLILLQVFVIQDFLESFLF